MESVVSKRVRSFITTAALTTMTKILCEIC